MARHGRYCSAAQGENRRLKDSLAELKDDARKAASEGGRAVTESCNGRDQGAEGRASQSHGGQ